MSSEQEARFTRFVAERRSSLNRLTWALTGDRQLGEDLAQESLQRLWRHWSRVSESGDPWPYLQKIAVSIASNWRRRLRYQTQEVLGTETGTSRIVASDRTVDVETYDEIGQWLADLHPRQRAAVILRFLCDLSVEQTAEILGCSPGTVKSQTSRALAAVRVRHTDPEHQR